MDIIFLIEGLSRGRRFWLLFSLERKVTRALTYKLLRSSESLSVRNPDYKIKPSRLTNGQQPKHTTSPTQALPRPKP